LASSLSSRALRSSRDCADRGLPGALPLPAQGVAHGAMPSMTDVDLSQKCARSPAYLLTRSGRKRLGKAQQC
jgi:hypothetical protein